MANGTTVAASKRAKRASEAAPPAADVPGLCGCCARAPGCSFTRDPSVPVRMCDEFEGLRSPVRGPDFHVERDPPPEVRNPARGLCSTCEAFAACTLTRPESGVWRCEEFR